MTSDVQCYFGGIAGYGTDEARIATAEEAKPQDMTAWRRRNPANVDDLMGGIEHWHLQPAIIASESGSPDDCPDPVSNKVQRRRRRFGRERRRPGFGRRADGIGKQVDTLEKALHPRV